MKLTQVLSRTQSQESLSIRKHIPWISSPLDETRRARNENEWTQEQQNARTLSFHDASRRQSEAPAFREHHESSVVELFYDLFFVANLTSFTSNHEIRDADSLKNYVGFFTLLWFTWLQTSLFDVRFSSDSIFNRACKCVSFGVMTGFAVAGALYDTSKVAENLLAFRTMSLVLLVSRLALILQYAVVLWYVKGYRQTFTPLFATMGALLLMAIIFLGSLFAFPKPAADGTPREVPHAEAFIAWYVVSVVEALTVIAISSRWRIVSFKHTHLVERLGLLTLIIMGEGIIGLSKSVSAILKTSVAVTRSDIGTIIAAVLLIYYIWVLYFDQIEHDRFGTIRQQIWAILHFPLHVAILLTVEGSSTLVLWNIIRALSSWLNYQWPYDLTPAYGFNSTAQLVDYMNTTIQVFASNFKNDNVSATFDYNSELLTLLNTNATFNSTDWQNQAGDVIDNVFNGLVIWMCGQFKIEAPESAQQKPGESAAEAEYDKANALFTIFGTVFFYFFIAAGAFLILLAVLYYFGKTHKSRSEYLSILLRVIAGGGIVVGCIAGLNYNSSINFVYSAWLVPTVMLAYGIVILLDNALVWHTNRTITRQTTHTQHDDHLDTGRRHKGGEYSMVITKNAGAGSHEEIGSA